jgi:hypothetical protein
VDACCTVCFCSVIAAVGSIGERCRLLDLIRADRRSMMGRYFSASRVSVRDVSVLVARATSVASL